MLLETVLGPVWAWVVLGQVPAARTVAGGTIIVAALVVQSVLTVRRPEPTAAG